MITKSSLKFAAVVLAASYGASASVIDYFFVNQDSLEILTLEIPAFTESGGTAANPTQATIFSFEQKLTGLTHVVVNMSPRQNFSNTVISKTARFALVNTGTGEELCTATFEGEASTFSPDWASLGCAWTGYLEQGEIIEVRATSTLGATLNPNETDGTGLVLGVGASFNVLTYALPKRKPKYAPHPYGYSHKPKNSCLGCYVRPGGYGYDDDYDYYPASYSAPSKADTEESSRP